MPCEVPFSSVEVGFVGTPAHGRHYTLLLNFPRLLRMWSRTVRVIGYEVAGKALELPHSWSSLHVSLPVSDDVADDYADLDAC